MHWQKNSFLLIGVILFAVFVGILYYLIFFQNKAASIKRAQNTASQTNLQNTLYITQQPNNQPVTRAYSYNPSSPFVDTATMSYLIKGIVSKKQPAQLQGKSGYELTLADKSGNIFGKTFFFPKGMPLVSFSNKATQKPKTIEDLTIGDTVTISVINDLKSTVGDTFTLGVN